MTYLTTQPASISRYLKKFNAKICSQKKYELWCIGPKTNEIQKEDLTTNIKTITQIHEFNNQLNQLIDA